MNAPPPNIDALRAFAARLERVDAVAPPDAPGATIVLALHRDQSGPVTFAGCGLDPESAFAACIGEAVEWSAQNGRQRRLQEADLALQPISDFNDLIDKARDADWIAMEGLAGTAPGRVPAALVVAGGRLRMPLSHGCAAGVDAESAVSAALCEWVERDAALSWWEGERTPCAVEGPAAAAAAEWLAQARCGQSRRSTVLLDIGGDSVVPVLVAASFDQDDAGAAFGMKAHADAAVAARGALREMAQMEFGLRMAQMKRARQGEAALSPGDVAALRRATVRRDSPRVMAGPRSAPSRAATGFHATTIAGLLAASGRRVWTCRLDDAPGVPVARALVSGLRTPLREIDPMSGAANLY